MMTCGLQITLTNSLANKTHQTIPVRANHDFFPSTGYAGSDDTNNAARFESL